MVALFSLASAIRSKRTTITPHHPATTKLKRWLRAGSSTSEITRSAASLSDEEFPVRSHPPTKTQELAAGGVFDSGNNAQRSEPFR